MPKAGQKEAMDAWLEAELAQVPDTSVHTYRKSLAVARRGTRTALLTMGLVESGVAVVAALALATLNVISVAQ